MPALEAHVLVYLVADMLGITSLKRIASKEFLNSMNGPEAWSEDLAHALSLVYTNTSVDDEDLQYRTTMSLVEKSQFVMRCPEVLKVIAENEPILWKACSSISNSLSTKLDDSKKMAAEQLSTAKAKAAEELSTYKAKAVELLETTKKRAEDRFEKYKTEVEWTLAGNTQILKALKGKNLVCKHGKKVFFECDRTADFKVTGIAHNCQSCFNSGDKK